MSNVIKFCQFTTMPISPDKVLESAVGELDSVIVIGENQDGYYFAASTANKSELLLLVEEFKLRLMQGGW